MRLITRAALVRIAILLVIFVAVVVSLALYGCRCGGKLQQRGAMPSHHISADRLRAHVEMLAVTIGPRNVLRPQQLAEAAVYIEKTWKDQGYEVTRQSYAVVGGGRTNECINLEATLRGTIMPGEVIVVGAHYDSVDDSPGANDNGSGVAALLELSRVFAKIKPARTLRFVAFTNEEPPYFQTAMMGSEVYARAARQRGDDIRGMLSLETMGYFSDTPGSQQYPPLFKLFYPNRGNFIGFVSNFKSRSLLHQVVRAFRAASDFPSECVATFESIPGVGWSDHASFWHQGYPAIMVTDTAPYRYPYYHTTDDLPDKVDYTSLARVTDGLGTVVQTLVK